MQKHINILATVYIVTSILFFLAAAGLLLMFVGVVTLTEQPLIIGLSRAAAGAVGLFLFLLAVAGIIVGVALHRKRQWGRVVAIVVSVVNLFNFPIGTLVGIYGLWVMLNPETVELFEHTDRRPHSGQLALG